MHFALKHFDITVMTFDLVQEPLAGFESKGVTIVEEVRHLLPIGLKPDSKGLITWLKARIVPQNRQFVDKILSSYGLAHNNLTGILQLCKGLSLNDCYWVTSPEDNERFADYNLFENPFNKVLSLIAYTGYGSVKPSGFSSSPEFTTNGMLRKGWRRIGGSVKLYKGGTSGAANTGNEPYSEFYASQVAEAMGLSHVPYTLSKWKHELCSVCELFTDIHHSFVPMWRFCTSKSLKDVADMLQAMGLTYMDAFCDMMIFDALVYNTDRHLNNFGLMVDNTTNAPYAFAPIFDNGMSLFPLAMADDIENLDHYAKSRLSAFDVSFDEIAKNFITPRQKEQLRRLSNFTFTRHPKYNLPAKRLKTLERFIHTRAHELLAY